MLRMSYRIATFLIIKSDGLWGLNQSRRLVSQKHYQKQATTATGRTSANRYQIVIGRLAYFILSYLYLYSHVTNTFFGFSEQIFDLK